MWRSAIKIQVIALRNGEWMRLTSTNQSGFGALPAGYRTKFGE